MSQMLGTIHRGLTAIEVYGEPGTDPQVVELRFESGQRLGQIGVNGAKTPRIWSVYDKAALASKVEAMLAGR